MSALVLCAKGANHRAKRVWIEVFRVGTNGKHLFHWSLVMDDVLTGPFISKHMPALRMGS